MAHDDCKFCSLPPEVRAAMESARAQGATYRALEKLSGRTISRPSICRHFQRCVPRTRIIEHGSLLGGIASGRTRVILAQPHVTLSQVNGRPTMNVDTGTLVYAPLFGNGPIIPEAELLESDVVFEVEYEPAVNMEARAAEIAAVKAEAEAREAAESATETTPN